LAVGQFDGSGAAIRWKIGPELATGPVPLPDDWSEWMKAPQTAADEAALRRCLRRGQPFGTAAWLEKTAKSFGLQSTQRRPRAPAAGIAPRTTSVI
jgi:hypothetical protein